MSNFVQDAEQAFDGNNNNNQQQNTDQNNSGGGGFMSDVKQGGEDAAINTEVNKFATKEGLGQGADGALDAGVDELVNKEL